MCNLLWTKPLKKYNPRTIPTFCFSPFPPNPGCLTPPTLGAPSPGPVSIVGRSPHPWTPAPGPCLEIPREGASHPFFPHLAQPFLHICPGPQLGSAAKAASWLWGTGHRPTPTTLPLFKGLSPPRCPFGLCEGARNRLEGSRVSAFCWGSFDGLSAPSFCPPSPPVGLFYPCSPRRAAEASHTLLTPPSSQPLPHIRGFSEAGSQTPCHPQLEVGYP